jgi:integrase
MASLSTDSNGNRQIQFIAADRKRRSVRLGKLPKNTAREIRSKVAALNAAAKSHTSIDELTATWLGKIRQTNVDLYDKLAAVRLAPPRAEANQGTLGAWIDRYIASRSGTKGSTKTVYGHTQRCLVEYFGAGKLLTEITAFEADDWRTWLEKDQELGENTIKRRCGIARQFFSGAVKARLIAENPFGHMKGIGTQRNPGRFYFVSQADAQKVLDACPDAQWKLLFALSRFGGLRCPSEHLALRWGDINWDRNRMTVHSPKTEHHEGKESRVVPIFDELRPYLNAVWDEADENEEFVITRYRDRNANLRTQLLRIIARAGVASWPKLFQNLRSTRQTELAENFPAHVVCAWIGNSEDVAREHYLQVTEDHFSRATEAVQNAVQEDAVTPRKTQEAESPDPVFTESYEMSRYCTNDQVGGTRLEPPSKSRRKSQDSGQRSNSVARADSDHAIHSELRTVIDAWPRLPATLRQQIVNLIASVGLIGSEAEGSHDRE